MLWPRFGRDEATCGPAEELRRRIRWAGRSFAVRCRARRVDHEREADEVEVLAFVADAVGASEPEAVVESAVDALGVVASPVEPCEVGVVGRDGPDVLGAVELAAVSSSVPCSRTVIVPPPRWSGRR